MKRIKNKSEHSLPKLKRPQRSFNSTEKKKNKAFFLPMDLKRLDDSVESNWKVLYKKIHLYDEKKYLIEISKTKKKFYVLSMEDDSKLQKLDFYAKQGVKLVSICGSVEELADKIEFRFGTLCIQNL